MTLCTARRNFLKLCLLHVPLRFFIFILFEFINLDSNYLGIFLIFFLPGSSRHIFCKSTKFLFISSRCVFFCSPHLHTHTGLYFIFSSNFFTLRKACENFHSKFSSSLPQLWDDFEFIFTSHLSSTCRGLIQSDWGRQTMTWRSRRDETYTNKQQHNPCQLKSFPAAWQWLPRSSAHGHSVSLVNFFYY